LINKEDKVVNYFDSNVTPESGGAMKQAIEARLDR
jgi:glutathione peroxidase-family protein